MCTSTIKCVAVAAGASDFTVCFVLCVTDIEIARIHILSKLNVLIV